MASIDGNTVDTRRAFDGVAADYDGPAGNNEIVQQMRKVVWQTLIATFPTGSRLLDLGCGTGLDLAELAERGYSVVGIDSSPGMVARTRRRIAERGLDHQAIAEILGIEDLSRLGEAPFDGIYSNFGPLNCVADLAAVGRAGAALLPPSGKLVVSAIGRFCPWEILHYAARFNHRSAFRRRQRGQVPVGLQGETVWTTYYSPREFARALGSQFRLTSYRALGLFLPPPYLLSVYRRFGRFGPILGEVDERVAGWPGLRDLGDHFLMVLTREPAVPR